MSDAIEFKFKRREYYEHIKQVEEDYLAIFTTYVNEVLKKEGTPCLTLENLNYTTICKETGKWSQGDYYTPVFFMMPHSGNYRVSLRMPGVHSDIFSFYIHGQNNCCGAMTVSNTTVYYKDKKLGTILQYFKEDIARAHHMSLLTCTDVYHYRFPYSGEDSLKTLTPYMKNTMILLNSGWEVSKLFFNKNSSNVVGLFTKNIPSSIPLSKQIIKMKIKEESKVIKIENFTIGADPELFLKSEDSGEFVASFKVIKGDKASPTPISEKGHNIQCDNVMVEYGIPPSKTAEEFVENNMFVQNYLKNAIAEPNGLKLVLFPFAEFTPNELKDDRASHFGCDPDFDVWNNGKPNEVGRAGAYGRCAGGHIHVGYDNHNRVTSNYIIKALDLFVSVPLILMEPDNRRKEMYGKAGSYRPQPWGVEYRSTSNYIFSSPELMTWAFNQVKKAIDFVNTDNGCQVLELAGSQIVRAINDKNVTTAKALIEKHNLEVLTKISS